jgi:hypothetical protein
VPPAWDAEAQHQRTVEVQPLSSASHFNGHLFHRARPKKNEIGLKMIVPLESTLGLLSPPLPVSRVWTETVFSLGSSPVPSTPVSSRKKKSIQPCCKSICIDSQFSKSNSLSYLKLQHNYSGAEFFFPFPHPIIIWRRETRFPFSIIVLHFLITLFFIFDEYY